MIPIITFEEYTQFVDTTDKSQREKFNKIYLDMQETYVRELLGTTMYAAVLANTYTPTNRPELFRLLKRCLAKKIEIYFIKSGTSQTTALGLVQRDSDFSKPAEIGQIKIKVEEVLAILRSYENQLVSVLEGFTEHQQQLEPITTGSPFRISATDDPDNIYRIRCRLYGSCRIHPCTYLKCCNYQSV